jgi:glycosyltransferase involved in cell wall biosynthesis
MTSNNNHIPVSVLMPVYNAGKTVAETITSVLNQTFKNFEFIIIDDGSTDNTEEVITRFNDERIKLIKNPTNLGIARTLNNGAMLCDGKYICRIDADDIFHRKKIEIQYKFMEKNTDCVVSGTHFRKIKNSKLLKGSSKHYFHVEDKKIRVEMLRNSPLCHPSVMFRSSLFSETGLRYNQEAIHCEDYGLWLQASKHGKLHIINRPLVYYRLHSDQISTKHASEQCLKANEIREELIRELLPEISTNELKIHLALMTDLNSREGIRDEDVSLWVSKICATNSHKKLYDDKLFNRMLRHREKRFFRQY